MMQARGENSCKRYVLVLTAITLLVYLAALKAGFLSVDDTDTLRYVQSGKVSLHDLFFNSSAQYYRPLTILSLLADYRLFGGNPAGYHLTNIGLHLASALLVFYLAGFLFKDDSGTAGHFYPFLAGIIFALHPINSEAVVWISARTDLLCCFFFLLCVTLLVRTRKRMSLAAFAGISAFFFCSLAAKEASLFLPFLALLFYFLERKNIPAKTIVAGCGALALAGLAYLLLRQGLPLTPDQVPDPSFLPAKHGARSIVDGAAATGFYLGKLFYPFPLNIAITEINRTSSCLILLAGTVTGALLWRKDKMLRIPLAFLALALVPPLGAYFLSLAWTPYAERYLYLPSVAFSLCAALVLRRFCSRMPKPVLVFLVLLAGIPTISRVLLWTEPVSFWQDAVAKSPSFGTIRLILAAEYLERNRCPDAEREINQATSLGLVRQTALDFSHKLQTIYEERCGASHKRDAGPGTALSTNTVTEH